MNNFVIAVFMAIVCGMVMHVQCGLYVIPNPAEMTGEQGKTLKIQWKINVPFGFEPNDLDLYYNKINEDKMIIFSNGKHQLITDYGKKLFGDRLSMKYDSNKTYTVSIKNAEYNDTSVFILDTRFEDKNKKLADIEESSQINVSKILGGPTNCGEPLPTTLKFKEFEKPILNFTFCGMPTPELTWNFTNPKMKTATPTTYRSFKHHYSVRLSNLTKNKCGMKLFYKVKGYLNDIIGSITIIVDFIPKMVQEIYFFRRVECYYVQWQAYDTGYCPVNYTIIFANKNQEPIVEFIDTVIYDEVRKNFTKEGKPFMTVCEDLDRDDITGGRIVIENGKHRSPNTTYMTVEDVRERQKSGQIIWVVAISVLLFMILVCCIYFGIKRLKEIRKRKEENSSSGEDEELNTPNIINNVV